METTKWVLEWPVNSVSHSPRHGGQRAEQRRNNPVSFFHMWSGSSDRGEGGKQRTVQWLLGIGMAQRTITGQRINGSKECSAKHRNKSPTNSQHTPLYVGSSGSVLAQLETVDSTCGATQGKVWSAVLLRQLWNVAELSYSWTTRPKGRARRHRRQSLGFLVAQAQGDDE